MPDPSLIDEIHHARTRWLSGDAGAWRHYLACCRHLESELQTASPDRMTDAQPEPRAVRQRAGRGTARRRGRRAPSRHS